MTRKGIALLAGVALQAAGAGAAFALEPPRQDFSLGQSGHSGAVCQAQRSWDGPVAALDGTRAWTVACRGWSQPLGRLYLLPAGGPAEAAWRKALAGRADCGTPRNTAGEQLQTCKLQGSGVGYLASTMRRGDRVAVAEGFGPIADVLETGLKVVGGRMRPPLATQTQRSEAAAATGDLGRLDAGAGAAPSLEHLRESAYREGQAYQFGQAEAQFQEMLQGEGGSRAGQAEAALNLALNVSNSGRFAEADRDFAEAERRIVQAGSPRPLLALALNYQAAHARNQRKFEEAVALARQAIRTRARSGRPPSIERQGDALVIGPAAEAALNSQRGGFVSGQLRADQVEAVRDAQALQIEGTSLQALGRTAEARQALVQGSAILQREGLAQAAPWLASRLEADIAELDLDAGAPRPAIARMEGAVDRYRRLYPGSLAEGRLLMELADMQGRAGVADRTLADQSLANYEAALDIFRRARGALGGSADLASGYFDILIRRIGADPAAHRLEAERFFDASQAVVSEAAALAAAQFAARISQGDGASAGISRARDDVRRQIDVVQGQRDTLDADIRTRQAAGTLAGAARAKADARVAALDASLSALKAQARSLEQQLLAANPRYGAVLDSRVTLSDLQASLKPDEAYVKVLLLSGGGYGMLITRSEARPYRVELTRSEAETLVAKVRKPFDDVARTGLLSSYDVASANRLYDKLFGPVKGELAAARRLIYEPDAVLIGVPAAALVTDPDSVTLMADRLKLARATHRPLHYDGVAWLGAKLESSVAVSASSFWQVRRLAVQVGASKAPQPFIGFGDPTLQDSPRAFASVLRAGAGPADVCIAVRDALLQLPPVPGAAQEVQTVGAELGASPADMVLGPHFTDTGVLAEGDHPGGLDQYRVIYFATHGLLPLPNGCLKPSLVTSLGPAPSDGLLDMDKIFDLKLDAEMVVLAACDTGRSGAQSAGENAVNGGGEALGGLVRAFIYAGARNLVVSNWEADSQATEQLMTTMFSHSDEDQSAALRDAELKMMQSPDAHSHPGYWAAFTLVGDGARAMPQAASSKVAEAARP